MPNVITRTPPLAPAGTRPTPARMQRFLAKLGVSPTQYGRWTGQQSFESFIAENEQWDLRSWQQLVLDHLERLRRQRRP